MKEVIFKGKKISVGIGHEVEVKGNKISPEIMKVADGVSVVAINDKNEIYIAKQYRFAVKRVTYELPGGGVDEGEDPMVAAKRELEEEIGIQAEKVEYLFKAFPSPAFDVHTVYTYFATGITDTKQNLDEDEDIHIITMDFDEFCKKVEDEEIDTDMVTIAALNKIKGRLKNTLKNTIEG